MNSRRRRLGLAALLLFSFTAPVWGPPLLRHLPGFEIERVEVSGARLLAPHEVLVASGIRRGQSVWDDPRGWEAALRGHPVVAATRVSRRLPGTLRVRVEEQHPVALVEAGVLRPVTATGDILPIDPTRAPLDLPLLRTPVTPPTETRVRDADTRALLAEAERLGLLDPGLVARISEVRRTRTGELLLILSQPLTEVVLPAGAGLSRLRQLRAVLEYLDRAEPGHAPWVAHVDLRFEDQAVVRYPSRRSSSGSVD